MKSGRGPAGTLKLALFGHPVGHSRSAELFAAAQEAGAPALSYEPVDVPPESLESTLRDLRAGRWDGANVTVPHKIAVAASVDELAPDAERSGAVNVLVRRGDRLAGDNTDGRGFVQALVAWRPEATVRRALILGSGGAARGVAVALVASGTRVDVVRRAPARLDPRWEGLAARAWSWDDPRLPEIVAIADLIVQATPLGTAPDLDARPPLSAAALGAIDARHLVVDLIYNPWQTAFLRACRERGTRALNGWPMLVHQAAAALCLWTDDPAAGQVVVEGARRLEKRDPTRGQGSGRRE